MAFRKRRHQDLDEEIHAHLNMAIHGTARTREMTVRAAQVEQRRSGTGSDWRGWPGPTGRRKRDPV